MFAFCVILFRSNYFTAKKDAKSSSSVGLASYVVWTSSEGETKKLIDDIQTGIVMAQDRVAAVAKKTADESASKPKKKRAWAKVEIEKRRTNCTHHITIKK